METNLANYSATRTVSAALIALALVLVLAPHSAFAHARVVSSTPANGSVAPVGLKQVTIVFTEDVSADQSNAQVLRADGEQVTGVTFGVSKADRTKMTVTTPPLPAGRYQVKWQAVTEEDNGHTDGVITFVVGESTCTTFKETGKSVCGKFLSYWDGHGGLAQQGFPISGELQEKSDTDGKTYTVQYFERAVFELHPENRPPNDILLSLLGTFLYKQKYPNGAPNQQPNNDPNWIIFKETGKRLGGKFYDYWRTHGGLAQQGFPISDEFQEKNELDGKTYTVQYCERAVFELHPENPPPYDVLLSQLGTFRYKQK